MVTNEVRGASRLQDPARLDALRATGLAETTCVSPALDRLTRLAGRWLRAPLALVTLVEAERQILASAFGLDGARETPSSRSFCRHVVTQDAPLVITDARDDDWVRDDAVAADGITAYAGVPLRSPDGHVLGSFCVVDTRPRTWTDLELETLTDLACAAESEIASRTAHDRAVRSTARMRTVLDTALDAYVALDPDGRVIAWNAAATRLFGWTSAEVTGQQLIRLVVPERFREAHERHLARVRATGRSRLAGRRLETAALDRAGREFPIELTLQISPQPDGATFHAFVRDISDRVDATAALDRERQRLADERAFLQTLLDSLDTGVVACDSDGRLALFNQALLQMHGTNVQPLDAETWALTYDLRGPDGRTALPLDEIPLLRAYAGQIVTGEEMVIAAPGVPARRFLANGRPITTPDGRLLGAVLAMHDITDSHRTETLRRAQHSVAQALADATSAHEAAGAAIAAVIHELGWVCGRYWEAEGDLDGDGMPRLRPVSSSPVAGTEDRGCPREHAEALAHRVWDERAAVVTGTDPESPEAGVRVGLPVREGESLSGVLTFCLGYDDAPHPDTLLMLESICVRIGRYLERRRTEDLTLALAAARRDFDRVAAQIEDYLWTVEILPDGKIRSLYASPNAIGIFGSAPALDADLGTILAEQLHPEDTDAFAAFSTAIGSGQAATIECRVRGFDGSTRWIWTRAVVRRENERLLADGICTNVTERRQLSEQRETLLAAERRQVARLQDLDRMKDELVAVVSHELRNPIGAIRGYAELLLDDPDLTDSHRRSVAVIDRTSTHLQHLADQLLDLARIDAGHINLDARPLPVTDLVQQALGDQQPAADAKHLTVTLDLVAGLIVHGDAVRLRQVLDNLLSNAIKYTPDGGSVTIAVAPAHGGVAVDVTDTGIGVPIEQLPKLFTRFFRASTAVDQGIKGTGLGLAVTKAIVEAHHGSITASPGPDGGTRFAIWLPCG